MKDELIRLIKSDCLEFGDFKLKSGGQSNFYLDLRKLTFTAMGMELLLDIISDEWDLSEVDSIGGPAVGAAPLVVICAGATIQGRCFLVRTENKEHGKGGLIVGSLEDDDEVFLIDDVVTTGGSIQHCKRLVEGAGANVIGWGCIVNRGDFDIPSLVTYKDLEL